jgi:hypothetical protein
VRRYLLSFAILAGFLLLTAPPAQAAKTHKLAFSISIKSNVIWKFAVPTKVEAKAVSQCNVFSPSQYFGGGGSATMLKIFDERGKMLAAGKTIWKVINVVDRVGEPGLRYVGQCALVTTIPKLPEAPFYQFKLGSFDAGTYTSQELAQDKWRLNLELKYN